MLAFVFFYLMLVLFQRNMKASASTAAVERLLLLLCFNGGCRSCSLVFLPLHQSLRMDVIAEVVDVHLCRSRFSLHVHTCTVYMYACNVMYVCMYVCM